MCVPPVSRKLLAFFPPPLFFHFSSPPPGELVDPPGREKKNRNCNYSSKWHELKLLVFLYIYIYIFFFFAANCTSFIFLEYWIFGHTFFGSSRWCLSRSISCENYVSKYGVTYVEDYLSTVILCTIKESLLCEGQGISRRVETKHVTG